MTAISEKPPVTIPDLLKRREKLVEGVGKVADILKDNGTNLFQDKITPTSPTLFADLVTIGDRRRRIVEAITEKDVPTLIGEKIQSVDSQIAEIANPLVSKFQELKGQGHLTTTEQKMFEDLVAKLPKMPEVVKQDQPEAIPAPELNTNRNSNFDPGVEKYISVTDRALKIRDVAFALGLSETPKNMERVRKTLSKIGLDGTRSVLELTPSQVREAAEQLIHDGIHGIDMDYARKWIADHPKPSYTVSEIQNMAGRDHNIVTLATTVRDLAHGLGVDVEARTGKIPANLALNIVSRLRPFNAAHSEKMKQVRKDPNNNYKKAKEPAAKIEEPKTINYGPSQMRVEVPRPAPVVPEPIQSPSPAVVVLERPATIPTGELQPQNKLNGEVNGQLTEDEAIIQKFISRSSDGVNPRGLAFAFTGDRAINEERARIALAGLKLKRPANISTVTSGKDYGNLIWEGTEPEPTHEEPEMRKAPPQQPERRVPDPQLKVISRPEAPTPAPATAPERRPAVVDPPSQPQATRYVEMSQNKPVSVPKPEVREEKLPAELAPNATDMFAVAVHIKASAQALKEQGFILDSNSITLLTGIIVKNSSEAKVVDANQAIAAGLEKIGKIFRDPEKIRQFKAIDVNHTGFASILIGWQDKSFEDFYEALHQINEANIAEAAGAQREARENERSTSVVYDDESVYALTNILNANNTRKLKTDFNIVFTPQDISRTAAILRTLKSSFEENGVPLPDTAACFDIVDLRLQQLKDTGYSEVLRQNEGSDARWLIMKVLSLIRGENELKRFRQELKTYRPI